MGHGCWYTIQASPDRSTRAVWVEVPYEDYEHCDSEYAFMDAVDDISGCLLELDGVEDASSTRRDRWDFRLYYKDNFEIVLKSTHHGSVLIDLELPSPAYNLPYIHLLEYNVPRVYNRIIRHLNQYMPVWIATSAWTAGECHIGEY